MAKATVNTVAFENNGATVSVKPLQTVEAWEEMEIFSVLLLRGKLKRANDRVKAVMGTIEAVGNNAKQAIVSVLKAKGVDDAAYDVAAAVASIEWPETEKEETGPKDWTDYDDAEELKAQIGFATAGAAHIFQGEGSIRLGLREFGQAIARVARSLVKPKHFENWVKAAPQEVKSLLDPKNAKAEFVFMGKLDQEYFDLAPESTISAKAFQQRFNVQKNDLVEAAVMEAVGVAKAQKGKAKGVITVVIAQEALTTVLRSAAELGEGEKKAQRNRMAEIYLESLLAIEGIDWLVSGDDVNTFNPAKGADDVYVAPTLFGSGNRPNEMVLAFCEGLKAEATKDQREEESRERDADNRAASAVKPRTFAQYGVKEAAYHLANILQAHDGWQEILDNVDVMADRVLKGEAWVDVLSDVRAGIDADQAEAEADKAEAEADDAA
jgi:hypothetical protein